MLIVVDHRMHVEVVQKLQGLGEVILFPKSEEVYTAISSHPDIFLFQADDELIVAPNTPASFVKELDTRGVEYRFGKNEVGVKYPDTVFYNAAYRDDLLLGNIELMDPFVLEVTKGASQIHTQQGYARCNHLILDRAHVLTSDYPTSRRLPNSLYVAPKEIRLEGFDHGFYGGCCGILGSKIFINGSLNYLADGKSIRDYIHNCGFEFIELYDGPLIDVGGIFFL